MLGADGAAKLGFAPCTGAAGRVFCWAEPAAAACPSESGAPQRMQNLELSGLCSKPQEGHFFIKTSGRCLGCCAKLEPGWRIGRYANVPVSHRKHIKRMWKKECFTSPSSAPGKRQILPVLCGASLGREKRAFKKRAGLCGAFKK